MTYDDRYEEWVQTDPISNSYDAIRNAKALLLLVMRLVEATDAGRLHPGMLVEQLEIATGDPGTPAPSKGGPGVIFRKRYDAKELAGLMRNLIFAALATSAIAADTALAAKLGPRDPTDHSDVGSRAQ